MKKIKILVAAMLTLGLSSGIYAQQSQTQVQTQTTGAPQSFKYQAVARNVNGDAIANQPVSFRITILQGSAEGTSVYQETQTATTNQFGLANLSIGNGIVVSGTFNAIDWSTGSYFIKTEFDPKGGENYTVMGTSQMMSVPYSLYAEHAKVADNVTSFPIKAALEATNLQAPFDAPATGTLVYNTDSAGTGTYAVVPGYYYNAGTATDPNWVLLNGTDVVRSVHRTLAAGANVTTYGGLVQDGGANHNVYAGFGGTIGAPTGADNTGFGVNVFGGNTSTNPSGTDNTGVGYDALDGVTSGINNTSNGSNALFKTTTGSSNTGEGYYALYNTTTSWSTAFGDSALASNNKGVYNTATGYQALANNIGKAPGAAAAGGYSNTADGYQALFSNDGNASGAGNNNTAIGAQALYSNLGNSFIGGTNNTALGSLALFYNQNAFDNTALGSSALYNNQTGISNTATGYEAIYGGANSSASGLTADGAYSLYNNNGSWNTATGDSAMYSNTSGVNNVANGYQALASNTTASSNSAFGTNALYHTTADANTAVGDSALYSNNSGTSNAAGGYAALSLNTSGSNQTAFGYEALASELTHGLNTAFGSMAMQSATGSYSTATGYEALISNTGNYNTADGIYSLYSNTTGGANVGIGTNAGYSTSTGEDNTTTGTDALQYNVGGSGNTAVGAWALHGVSSNSADYNTAVGDSSSYKTTTGGDNASLGYKALYTNTTGTENTAIGYGADVSSSTLSNATAIGYNAKVGASNSMQLGNSSLSGLSVGVSSSLTSFYIGNGILSGTGTELVLTTAGFIVPQSSSRRYKKNITDLNVNSSLIYKLRPVSYIYKSDSTNTPTIGLIAEEVAPIIPELVVFAPAKNVIKGCTSDSLIPDAVHYNVLSVLLLKAVQEQQLVIDSLKKVNSSQVNNIQLLRTAQAKMEVEENDKMATQEKEIAELKRLVEAMTQAQASIKQ